MRVYIKSDKKGIDAIGEYDTEIGTVTVLKRSRVSDAVSCSKTFRGAKQVISLRAEFVEDDFTVKDLVFKSASTAANFVTGTSSNGLIVWKDKNGITLKEVLANKEADNCGER